MLNEKAQKDSFKRDQIGGVPACKFQKCFQFQQRHDLHINHAIDKDNISSCFEAVVGKKNSHGTEI